VKSFEEIIKQSDFAENIKLVSLANSLQLKQGPLLPPPTVMEKDLYELIIKMPLSLTDFNKGIFEVFGKLVCYLKNIIKAFSSNVSEGPLPNLSSSE
jgi:hypothetical protein